jgi:hypothetical protein
MTDEKPWRLANLIFEPMGDDRRERATIDGVVIVRQDGRYSITAPEQEWSNIDEDEVDPRRRHFGGPRRTGPRRAHAYSSRGKRE